MYDSLLVRPTSVHRRGPTIHMDPPEGVGEAKEDDGVRVQELPLCAWGKLRGLGSGLGGLELPLRTCL